ncbi:MAG: cytochrome c3 family protein [Planctomycetota bacterium]
MIRPVPLALFFVASFSTAAGAAHAGQDEEETGPPSCVACHSDPARITPEGLEIARKMELDVHAAAGLSCHDCHGGDPAPSRAADPDGAHAGMHFAGIPPRTEIPAFCGRCHSDPVFMRRFRPAIRVDQVEEYGTSGHGLALARGDTQVATCVDCHGTHGIVAAGHSDSPVYPTHVAETCGRCHSDPARMAGRTLPDGRPLSTGQQAAWQRSVHAAALLERGDLTAPTCNDCHGNHGAVPPGVESITYVCGQCHGREAELFRQSPKFAGFVEHNEMLAEEEEKGCAACHEPAEPAAAYTRVATFTECTTCHGNHAVIRPSMAMLAPLPPVPCAFCHEPLGDDPSVVPEPVQKQQHYDAVKADLLARAALRGLEGAGRFDWLLEEARRLPDHVEGEAEGGGLHLRPEFQRLFEKLRLGSSRFAYRDPARGADVEEAVVSCDGCHAAQPALASAPVGLDASRALLAAFQELAALTARAERIVLQARRGGVETKEAMAAIDHAVDAQISLQVLVHTFSAAPGSPFQTKHAEGLQHARAALDSGQGALDELAFRRRGLAMSLVVILAVLVALGMKIRQISARAEEAEPAADPRGRA